ncbi:FkbM family methyltransferase [Gluconobacter sp. Dm-62]|uniref:FkbM family methyltransferase n=1 Tax=Gluconobacter sp. Dm-62 TaxID=2799804 RepID=UPI001B8C60D0|nr:FkbM family methyltransferase [Gluconobacter sp. Dm-62]MBS1103306.1 FkbM family methyltransferase [Gluconobacter sp. Dm-62]
MTRTAFSSITDTETRYGKLKVPDLKHDLIGRFLDYYGEWAFNEVRFCASLLDDGARVLDIGAFIGTFGLGVASLRRLTSLCAVEGNPELIPFLSANIALAAHHPEISVINAIVAPENYEVHGHYGQDENLGSTSFVYDEAIADIPDDVPAKATSTLTRLRQEKGPFDLIKIDAEGMEYAILADDRDFIATGESLIWIECNEEKTSLDCADLLLGLGLKLHYFAFPAHNSDNHRGQTAPLMPWAYEAGLLASRDQSIPELDETLSRNLCILKKITSREALRRALWETPRWAPAEWPMTASGIYLAALASRQVLKQSYENFLGDHTQAEEAVSEGTPHLTSEPDTQFYDEQQKRLDKAEESLEFARKLALERLDELHKADAHVQDLETALNEARNLLQDARQTEANIRSQLKQTEQGLQQAQDLAFERLSALEKAEQSRQEAAQTEINLWKRLEQTEAGLAEAQKLAFERLDALNNQEK